MKKGIKELTDGMQRLCAVANRIVSDGGKVSRIEVDLLMDNLRRLYDVALTLSEDSTSAQTTMDEEALLSSTMMATRAAMGGEERPETPEPEEIPENTVKPVMPEIKQEKQEAPEVQVKPEVPTEPAHIMAEVETENSLMFDEVVIETTEPEPQPEPAPEPEPEPEPEPIPQPEPEPEPAPVPQPEPEPEPEPVPAPQPAPAPQPVQEQTTLEFAKETPEKEEEPAAGKRQPSLLDYLRHPAEDTPTVRTLGDTLRGSAAAPGAALERKVSDLRTVININDKFSFMTELFHGNMKAYNDFIMQLNDIADRDEAMRLVEATSAQYHWDEESLAVVNFRKVFDKKF